MNYYEVKHILYLLNSILNGGLPLFLNLKRFLSMLKLEKLGGKNNNMASYRPSKYEDDEIRKNINPCWIITCIKLVCYFPTSALLRFYIGKIVCRRWDFNPCIFMELWFFSLGWTQDDGRQTKWLIKLSLLSYMLAFLYYKFHY